MSFTNPIVKVTNIGELASRPNKNSNLTAPQLQALYDKFGLEFQSWFTNVHLAELASSDITSSGSNGIGSGPINGVAGTTVYAQLVAIKGIIDSMVLGQIPLGTIGVGQLSFDPATQAELDAINSTLTTLIGTKADQAYDNATRTRLYMGV